ncbi:MAG: DUF1592 domain-containing protein [Polyangiaceae bacterium]|nr:DUF1592 domain-containing protein [Polyangiaceae bacterium]
MRPRPFVFALAVAAGCARSASIVAPAHEPGTHPHPTQATHAPLPAAPAPLRRLSNEEYDNSVRDLLGDTTRPAADFPPDELAGGFESGSVSPVTQSLVERYLAAAEALSAAAAPRLPTLGGCVPAQREAECAAQLVERLGRAVFRRPVEPRERDALTSLYARAAPRRGHERALALVVQAMLQSPAFLYRAEPQRSPEEAARALTGYELATRLSYFLWASTPDERLLDDAGAGRLACAEGVEAAARRLLADRRAIDGVRNFYRQWLDLRELGTVSRDARVHPEFTPELRRSMVEETLRFAADATLEGRDLVRALYTSQESFVDAALARHYGVEAPTRAGFSRVSLPAARRAGVLTHASVLTVHASAEDASPVMRGKFVREKVLCQEVPPPPPNVAIALPRVDPSVTKKERFATHRVAPACGSCHRLMDPVGFGFEHYDATGAWRDREGGRDVDATGVLEGAGGPAAGFDGAVALGELLAESPRARRCVTTQWLRAALGRRERDEDEASLEAAHAAFVTSGFDARALLIAIVKTDSFRRVGFDRGAPQ